VLFPKTVLFIGPEIANAIAGGAATSGMSRAPKRAHASRVVTSLK
jgi:hypothetical protein